MHKNLYSFAMAAIFFLGGCESIPLIKNEIKHTRNAWEVTIKELNAGPDTFNKTFRAFLETRPVNSLADKIMAGANVYNHKINPKFSDDGYLWLLLTVKNMDKANHGFDFSRIRLVSEKYVINPEIVLYSSEFNKKFMYTIKPDESFTITLVFEYNKGNYPHKLIYDNQIAGKIFDKISIDLPAVKI